MEIKVNLTPTPSQIINVNYTTSEITATEGVDYIAPSGTISFGPEETQKLINIPIIPDSISDGGESFKVTLSNDNPFVIVLFDPQETFVTINDSTVVDIWKYDNFSATQFGIPSIDGDFVDFDNDGMNTLLEYAFENSPTVPGSFIPVRAYFQTDEETGDTFLHFTYPRRKGGNGSPAVYNTGGLSYVVEYSEDLVHWDTASGQIQQVGNPEPDSNGVTETVNLRFISPINPKNITFVRLRVNRNESN